MADNQLFIIIISGQEDEGFRASIAFSVALSAQAMGYPVTIFYTGNGSIWGGDEINTNTADNFGFPSLSQMKQLFIQQGGKELLCEVCSRFCMKSRLRNEVELVGFTSIIPMIMESKTLVF